MNYNLDTKAGMANAVKWTTEHFAKLKDGGMWMVPRSGTLVQVNHTTKTATLHAGVMPDPSIRRVIKAMGWTVTEK